MHFSKDLYISDSIKIKEKKLIRKIKYDKGITNVFLIYKNPRNNNIEFMPSYYFKQRYLKMIPFEIIGMVSKYDEAIEYLAKITCEKLNVILDTEDDE